MSSEAIRDVALRLASAASSDGAIITTDLAGMMTAWNPAAEHIFGHSTTEAVGQSIRLIVPQEVQWEQDEILRRITAGESIDRYDTVRVGKDGQRIDVSLTVSPLATAAGQIVGASKVARVHGKVVAYGLDTPDYQHLTRELAHREARLRTIIDTEPECVTLLGLDGCLLDMNPAGLRMIEADSLLQVAGRALVSLVIDEDKGRFSEFTDRVFRGESGTLEFQIVGLKGGRRWLETHATPLRGATGAITSLLGITRDVTARHARRLRCARANHAC